VKAVAGGCSKEGEKEEKLAVTIISNWGHVKKLD
jgi:hypothetical protein